MPHINPHSLIDTLIPLIFVLKMLLVMAVCEVRGMMMKGKNKCSA